MVNQLLGVTLAVALLSGNQDVSAITREAGHEIGVLPHYSLFDWIEFGVKSDGTVTLRGQTIGVTLRSDAEAAISRIDGVSMIINQIESLPESPGDQQIRREEYRAVYDEDGPLFHYALEIVPTIHLIVANGHVTLRGSVNTAEDKRFAEAKARGVAGVVEVTNELVVAAGTTS
jgi:hyperosmotically inducible protein